MSNARENVMRRTPQQLSDLQQDRISNVKEYGADFWDLLDRIGISSGHSRELQLAKDRVEEAVMWATKHITAP
ncbi:MAG: hypothetical protein V2J24_23590 [Pseudomonadales bacterium]|jgi:hypothetical protein|nr:hypothetical protein [Pseudomonadales bacterium]